MIDMEILIVPFLSIAYFFILKEKWSGWFAIGEKLRGKAVFEPLFGCEVCNAGQLTLFLYPVLFLSFTNPIAFKGFVLYFVAMYLFGMVSNLAFFIFIAHYPFILGHFTSYSVEELFIYLVYIAAFAALNMILTRIGLFALQNLQNWLKIKSIALLKQVNEGIRKHSSKTRKDILTAINEATSVEDLKIIEEGNNLSSVQQMFLNTKEKELTELNNDR